MIKAALFDLDGVVFDTEPQYTIFWGRQCRKYHPDKPGLEQQIKGQTLVQILDRFFSDMPAEQQLIVEQLDAFEQQMKYDYVTGFENFVADIRRHGLRTAVVTSSNRLKMQFVYAAHPEFKSMFDAILTSEDFSESKPSPQCYLTAAGKFGLDKSECVVFEDSFNGLRSGRAAGMHVVGLSTTNAPELVRPLADSVIADYSGMSYEKMCAILAESR